MFVPSGYGLGAPYDTISLSDNQFSNGSLLIPSASKRAEGQYTCSAENGVRSTLTKTVNLTVNGRRTDGRTDRQTSRQPRINQTGFVSAPPRFAEKSNRLNVRKGEKADLVCSAKGDEPMDITWRRNGIAIRQEEDAR